MGLVVIAVLVAIAVPTYQTYVLRSNRADAKALLTTLQAAEQGFYLRNRVYTDEISHAAPSSLALSEISARGYYKVSVTLSADRQSYMAKAVPVPGALHAADTRCASFTLTDTGLRDATGTSDRDTCWR